MSAPGAASDPASGGLPAQRPRYHKRSATGFLPEKEGEEDVWTLGDEKVWKANIPTVTRSTPAIEREIVHHVYSSLARQPYGLDELGAYQAVALSVRDKLVQLWNETQAYHTIKMPKRVYYFSLEFLMGRTLDSALLNLALRPEYVESVKDLGFRMEDVIESERDAALGNGGLGRLAACYLDSMASLDLPAWGYGLRYTYGMFKQGIRPDGQIELPDPWLEHSNPWEVARLDVTVDVRFYGTAERLPGKGKGVWRGGKEVLAVAYDVPTPGAGTDNTNNLRLWASRPKREFDLGAFNAGDYDAAVAESVDAETISSVLYPNDNFYAGKELRLKQQYLWCAASLHDIIRRFKKMRKPFTAFPDYVAIQLNDTHPTIAIPELQRILVDEEDVEWDTAWAIVQKTFGYTNHTVMPEALEKWPVPMLSNLLPRHMQIIFDINLFFLQAVERKFPKDRERLARMSLIEEGNPQQVRFAFLAVIGSHHTNGVAALHSQLVKTQLFPEFVEFFGAERFGNVTNGITPRRWLQQANPPLASLITSTLGTDLWVKELDRLKALERLVDDAAFHAKWNGARKEAKARFAEYAKKHLGLELPVEGVLWDVQVKRIHEYKRQSLNILGVLHRYRAIKFLSPEDRKKVVPKVVLFGGKAAPGYYIAKQVIRLIVQASEVINNDPDIGDLLKVVFVPDYSVSVAEVLIPAADISQHISTAGTEASGTSNMKFCLNGALLVGTVDGASIEIGQEVGEDQCYFFGHLSDQIEDLRYNQRYHRVPLEERSPALAVVVEDLKKGTFGNYGDIAPLIDTIINDDHYCVADDFDSYIDTLALIDADWVDKDKWAKKSILTVARMGFFSSDRAVNQYAEEIWSVEPEKVNYATAAALSGTKG